MAHHCVSIAESGSSLSPGGLETTNLTEIHFHALGWSWAWMKRAAAYCNAGRSKTMAVNKSNPLSHWAGATATLHPVTPHFIRHQAAQGARPRLPGPVNRPADNTALLLPPSLLPHPAPRLQESPGRHQVSLPAYVIQLSWNGGKTPKHNQD